MEEFFEITGMNIDELRRDVADARGAGRIPFFHYTRRAGTILKGPLIDEILNDLYSTFDRSVHTGYLVPEALEADVLREIQGYGR